MNLSSSRLRLLLLSLSPLSPLSRDKDLLYCRGLPYRSRSSDLCLRGDLLLLRGEERDRRRGDGDLRLRGERLTLRRDALGLVSLERSLPEPTSGRGRFLEGESCLSSLLLMSSERLRPLRGDARVLDGEVCLDVLSEALAEGWSLCRGEGLRRRLGLRGRLCGDRFSFPEEASFEGDLAGLLSRSTSGRPGRSFPVDLDRRALSSRVGEERLSVRLPFCSTRDGDVRLRSLDLSTLSDAFLSLDLLLSRPLSLASESLVLFVALSLDSFCGLSTDLLRLRRLELDLVSGESRLDLILLPPLGETTFPELLRCLGSPFLTRASASSSEPEL